MQFLFNIGNSIGQFIGYILWLFFDLFDNYALAVVCFTIFVKACMFPFDIKGRKAMVKSMRLNKKRLELEKRYKSDRQKLNEEITKLYQKEGINPAGGCLPQFIPMFAFMGVLFSIAQPLTNMFHISANKIAEAVSILKPLVGEKVNFNSYYSQLNVIKYFPAYQDSLLMFNDTEKNAIADFNKGFHLFGLDLSLTPNGSSFLDFIWILPVLCIVTNFIAVFINQKLNTMPGSEGPGCMKFLPYFMSVPYILFVFNVPAGVGFYYIVFNILNIVQTFIVWKFFNVHILAAKEEAARVALLEVQESKVGRM
ncbi:MAG: YidC/Oxa1 family membrane protein insertase [Clostridia bacterium]|nr:YidC/Oxa1 family membrane protein insertase [Clostridia bacterium]